MSKTYKDQLRYDAKHWWSGDRWGTPPQPKDINEPEWWKIYRYHSRATCAKWWINRSHREKRRKLNRLIREGKYTEAKHLKPRNVDWEID